MISRFFFPEPLPQGGEVRLPDATAHHAARVLRLRDGDPVMMFDGRGDEVHAQLSSRGKQWYAILGERQRNERESPLSLVLVQALAGGDKMDWIVQKAVELGVTSVIPVRAERSVLRLAGERADKRVVHWQQVAVSACEQSGRSRVPQVAAIVDLADYLGGGGKEVVRVMLDPRCGKRLAAFSAPPAGAPLHLLVGPEGGWSDSESGLLKRSGCAAATLGPRVLRTETAGIAALSAVQTLWGDF